MGTNCAPFVADLFCFVMKEIFFMMFLSDDIQNDTEAFNSTSRYLDDLTLKEWSLKFILFNNTFAGKIFQQVYQYHKLQKAFSKFYSTVRIGF